MDVLPKPPGRAGHRPLPDSAPDSSSVNVPPCYSIVSFTTEAGPSNRKDDWDR
jgi:hypothetical protein